MGSKLKVTLWVLTLLTIIYVSQQYRFAQQIRASAHTEHSASAQKTRPVDPYEFAQAVIKSLSWATDARQVIMSSPVENKNTADALASMTNARIAISKLERAKDVVRQFSNSDNKAIQTSVRGFDNAYDQLTTALTQSIQSEEKLLSVSNSQELGALLSEASKWGAQADEAWKLLIYATIAASYGLIDNERLTADGKHGYLAITAAQRDQLLADLEHHFGDSVKKGMSVGQYATEAAPAALWNVLNQPWKFADAS